ncbi:unnamed protein product [Mytilus edulis]|uniref:Neurotransmitter-gated ion-channel ligand-binding domain-containing protein n=1 Tax=Mytilus edulis TaxID=6550 RepID=A0A8S3U606_MYTED|nr:unnamed protein product [Mytilus edulis]
MPLANHSKQLHVGVEFFLNSFISMSEVDETISIMGTMLLNWTDPALQWDVLSFDNLFVITLDPSDIWTPLMFLVNAVDEMEPIGKGVIFYSTLMYTGQVYTSPGGIMKAKCPTNVAKFPFDTQECNFMFLNWGLSTTKIKYSSSFDQASGLMVVSVIVISKYYFEENAAEINYPLKRLANWGMKKKRNVVLPMEDHKKDIDDIDDNITGKDVANAKRIMPLADHSQQLDVGVDFYLNSFISINEVDETISIMGSILLNLTDPVLKWEFWSFDNLYYIIIDPSDIWTPLIFLANSAEQIEPIGNGVFFCFSVHWTGLHKPRRNNEGKMSY